MERCNFSLQDEDQKGPIRLTKLSFSSVFPKSLQRQNTGLVCQVFNEKTVAAMKSLKEKLDLSQGTIIWIDMICQWYKMMSVKSKFAASRRNDESREAWTNEFESFNRLSKICEIISSCIYYPAKGRVRKLTQQTGQVFIVTTKNNILAAKFLLENYNFKYVLPAIWSQNPIEKFFGQARQRFGGNFYIDIVDVMAAAKAQHLHQLMKYDIIPEESEGICKCDLCDTLVEWTDEELLDELTIDDTAELLESNDTLKQKIVYISGYLARKYGQPDSDDSETVSCDFLEELNRGGLHTLTLYTVYFVHSAMRLYEKLDNSKKKCCRYLVNYWEKVMLPFLIILLLVELLPI